MNLNWINKILFGVSLLFISASALAKQPQDPYVEFVKMDFSRKVQYLVARVLSEQYSVSQSSMETFVKENVFTEELETALIARYQEVVTRDEMTKMVDIKRSDSCQKMLTDPNVFEFLSTNVLTPGVTDDLLACLDKFHSLSGGKEKLIKMTEAKSEIFQQILKKHQPAFKQLIKPGFILAVAKKMNEQAPVQVDDAQRLDKAIVLNNTLEIQFTYLDTFAKDDWLDIDSELLRSNVCSSLSSILDTGASIRYVWFDLNKTFITSKTYQPKDCVSSDS